MKPIQQCLNQQLATICETSVQLETIRLKVIQHLPELLKPHCHVSSFQQGSLTLATANAAWASQLRYVLPELRDNLRQDGMYQLTSLKIIIMLPPSPSKPIMTRARPLSEIAIQAIVSSAAQCAYPPLQAALYRLARMTS